MLHFTLEFSLLEVYLHIQSLKEIKDFKLSMWNNKIAVFLWEFKIYILSFKLSYSFSKYSRYSNLLNYAAILFFISHIDCLLSFGGVLICWWFINLKKIFGPFENLYITFFCLISFLLLALFFFPWFSFKLLFFF